MFANFKNRLASVIAPDMPALPSSHDHHHHRGSSSYHERLFAQQNLRDKFVYERPHFLDLHTADELKASADHNLRPIIVPRVISLLPWSTGYADCVNSGKSEWNEDQANFCTAVLSDPSDVFPDLPYTYFGIFDGHAGFGAALAASKQFHHILHEKLVDCIELLLPREGMEEPVPKSKSVNSFPHPIHFQRTVTKDEVITGALESAFFHMDSLIAQDRDRYRDAGGCTACVALFINGKMYVSNAGDSRAVLCQRKSLIKDETKPDVDGTEGTFPVPFSFDHTPETERQRLLGVALYKPHLMGNYYTAMEYAKRPHIKDLGQRILCRQGTNKGWTYKTLTRDDLKMPVVTGEGKRSRLLGTLGVTRGFGDHDLLAIATRTLIKPFLTPQPDVNYRDLTKIVSIPGENNEDGDYGVLVIATDGLWDVSENDAVARTVFQTLHKYPTEKHRYTMVAQELVAKARGKINDYGHWRLADSKAAATVDDISVFVIPVHQYYKEHIEWEQKALKIYKERVEKLQNSRLQKATEAREVEVEPRMNGNGDASDTNVEMAQIEIEPEQEPEAETITNSEVVLQTKSNEIDLEKLEDALKISQKSENLAEAAAHSSSAVEPQPGNQDDKEKKTETNLKETTNFNEQFINEEQKVTSSQSSPENSAPSSSSPSPSSNNASKSNKQQRKNNRKDKR